MNAGSPTLVVSGLTQLYAERRVVDDLSFTAGPGEAVALVGPNGSGMTTVLRCVVGAVAPTTQGTVELADEPFAGGRHRHRPGLLGQSGRYMMCRPTYPCVGWWKPSGMVARISNPSDFHSATARVLASTTALNCIAR
jgi:ABC-type Mn2+/Zn2+ transport system ATPase subunit